MIRRWSVLAVLCVLVGVLLVFVENFGDHLAHALHCSFNVIQIFHVLGTLVCFTFHF